MTDNRVGVGKRKATIGERENKLLKFYFTRFDIPKISSTFANKN
jgi:hypothetical protein